MGNHSSSKFLAYPHGPSGFKKSAEKRKYKLKRPTRAEKLVHVDMLLAGLDSNKKTSVVSLDIKYITPGAKVSAKWQWLELRDGRGRPGWIYKEADFIVFERKADFILVNRKNLVQWINSTTKVRYDLPPVKNGWKAKYRLFQRPDKKDLITQIQTDDILKINGTTIWEKERE